jgi:hypothetical protein
MILLAIIIYFLILAVIEFFFIVISGSSKKDNIKDNIKDNKNLNEIETLQDIELHNLIKNVSTEDVYKNDYVGEFYLETEYGFYIILDNWNLLEPNKLYNFDIPVNNKIIKIMEEPDIIYYSR